MTRILGVELRRFAWRRSFRFFGLVAVAGSLFAATLVFFNSRSAEEGQRAAIAQREQIVQDCIGFTPDEAVPRQFGSVEEYCESIGSPPASVLNPTFRLTTLGEIYEGMSIPLIILGLAFGASFIGAEWHHGTITATLTWDPRRVMVFVGKALAAMVAVILAALAIQAILGVMLWVVAVVRGSTEGAGLAWFWETLGSASRGALIAGLAAMLGFAIASGARNTTTALIIGLVYFAVAESLIRGLRPAWQPWLVGDNAAAFVTGDPAQVFMTGGARSTVTSLLVVVAYAAVAVGLGAAWFRSRDVT